MKYFMKREKEETTGKVVSSAEILLVFRGHRAIGDEDSEDDADVQASGRIQRMYFVATPWHLHLPQVWTVLSE
jgi:hypothetical protein